MSSSEITNMFDCLACIGDYARKVVHKEVTNTYISAKGEVVNNITLQNKGDTQLNGLH